MLLELRKNVPPVKLLPTAIATGPSNQIPTSINNDSDGPESEHPARKILKIRQHQTDRQKSCW